MRRKRLPPDTRPQWNDPNLTIAEISEHELQAMQEYIKDKYQYYDSLPKPIRDYLKENDE